MSKALTPVALRSFREARGWTRSELGRRATMQASLITQIESGRFIPYDSQLEKLARALNVADPDELMKPLEGGQ